MKKKIKKIVRYEGDLVFDSSKPDRTPRKLLDVPKLFDTGWKPKVALDTGVRNVYKTVFNK
ncbi:MAG: hypothetical protein HQ521_03420 [Bacteroidetes bacterium]|nr:hypothetical protein [Bacteroidota bacterium]